MEFFTCKDARKWALSLKNLIYKNTTFPQRLHTHKKTYELTMVGLQICIMYISCMYLFFIEYIYAYNILINRNWRSGVTDAAYYVGAVCNSGYYFVI